MDSLEEIDKFLEMYNLPSLNKEKRENMNRLIMSNEIWSLIEKNNFLKTKVQDQVAWQMNSIKYLQKHEHVSFSNCSKKLQRKYCFWTHFMRYNNPDTKIKDITKGENYRPISLMNIDTKSSTKY